MSNPWFRMHSEMLNDPKVQTLPAETFRVWVNLLCVTNDSVSSTFHPVSCAFLLRMNEQEFETHFETLLKQGLFVQVGGEYQPSGWNKRQFKSDTSTERVRKHRAKKKECNDTGNVTSTVTVTPPDTDTDTDKKTNKKDVSPCANEQEFAQWWDHVPKRVGKTRAQESYSKAVASGVSHETLLVGIRKYAVSVSQTEAQYIKHPSSWLNQKCWEDDPPPPRGKGVSIDLENYTPGGVLKTGGGPI